MSVLGKEVENIQNPALGATILWRFISSYYSEKADDGGVPIPLLYIILSMIYHTETLEVILSTNKSSGLRMFADKFYVSKTSKSDVLLSIHTRSLEFKELTTDSIRVGLASKLFGMISSEGKMFPLSKAPPKSGIPDSIKSMHKASEKLGDWCANLTLHEISTILKVRF
ncbi:MAG: DUF6521 family protein [Paenibacillus sp.]|nr:DUF6521 family protein [Paenibacillus sp.]